MVKIGDRAPSFELPKSGGGTWKLADHLGKRTLVIYFYPADETAGCTIEACAFRDSHEDFVDAGAEVIGISEDSVDSHDAFRSHHRLPFVLLSDLGAEVAQKFGVEKRLFGLLRDRVTFVIDRSGVVKLRFDSMIDFKGHVKGALELIRQLEGSAPKAQQVAPEP